MVDAGADSAFELSKPIDLSNHEACYDVEDDCCFDEEPPPSLEPEQEGLVTSTPIHDHSHSRYYSPGPPHDQIGQYDDDGNTQHTLEEPAHHSLPKLLDEDSGGGSDDNVTELERDMLLAFEEQEKSSSVSPPSSPRPPRRSVEPAHPQIDQVHDQSGTSHGRLEELRHGSPLGSQVQEEELQEQQQQQQQQEVAADAMREGEDGDDDDREQRDKQGGKRRRAEEAEEKVNSSGAVDGDNEDDDDDYNNDQVGDNYEGLRLAKRRQLLLPMMVPP